MVETELLETDRILRFTAVAKSLTPESENHRSAQEFRPRHRQFCVEYRAQPAVSVSNQPEADF
jgi:hypothetical protein